jgi:2,4-diaminopentanoate dehydrogenase
MATSDKSIRVLQYGLGPIGCELVRQMSARPALQVVGGIDIDPAKVGQDLGQVAGMGTATGLIVSADPILTIAGARPDVVVHTTSSSLATIRPQIEPLIRAGIDIITTCEEAAFPRLQNPPLAEELDRLARQFGSTVLGTGINPGFAMDTIAMALSAPSRAVRSIAVHRVVDAGERRLPLQQKVGAGLTLDDFEQRKAAGKIRHVGLPESVALLAYAMGWELDGIDEVLEPVVAEQALTTQYLMIPAGHVAGIHQYAVGRRAGAPTIVLTLDMFVGAQNPGEHILLDGEDRLETHIKGIHGDRATGAVVVNCIPRVIAAPAGFLTMADLPVVHYWE